MQEFGYTMIKFTREEGRSGGLHEFFTPRLHGTYKGDGQSRIAEGHMNIAIAINGEGRGHLARCTALAEGLSERAEIHFFASAHQHEELRELFPAAGIHDIPCLRFVQRGFRLDYTKTALANAATLFNAGRHRKELAARLKALEIAAVISDFEPFVSRAAKKAGIPVLQLNHPGIITRVKSLRPSAVIARMVATRMMTPADRSLICSFFDGDIGPMLRRELREETPVNGSHIAVYKKALYADVLDPLLDELSQKGHSFRVFPDPAASWARALATSKAVVAPAGHQSISEALALGKPVLAIPVEGQFEQELNAQKLRKSGSGDWCSPAELPRVLPRFLGELDERREAILAHRKNPLSPFCTADESGRALALVEAFIADYVPASRPQRTNPRQSARKALLTALLGD